MFPTQEHIEAAQKAANHWKARTGVYVWPSVTLAQADDESAGWTILSGKNNGFGIKATKAQIAAGKATIRATKEQVNGKLVRMNCYFADFDSLEEAYSAHAALLATSRYYYKSWKVRTPQEFIAAVGPVYATVSGYSRIIRAFMDKLDLYKYDQPGAVAGPVREMPGAGATVAAGGAAGAVIATAGATLSPYLAHVNLEMVAAGGVVALLCLAIFIFVRRHEEEAAPAHHAAPLAPPPAAPVPVPVPPVAPVAPVPVPAAPAATLEHVS